MSPNVSFLNLVGRLSTLLEGHQRAAYAEGLCDAWQERGRVERLMHRFSELLEADQQEFSAAVEAFMRRCAADPRIGANADFASMSRRQRQEAFEKTVTGAGLIMRDQLPLKRRRLARQLTVNWSSSAGLARWDADEPDAPAFQVQAAAHYAAKHLAGMADDLAAAVAERLTQEFRAGEIEITGLRKVGESAEGTVYNWESGGMTLGQVDESDAGGRAALPSDVRQPLVAWLRDMREPREGEAEAMRKQHRRQPPWQEAVQLVDEASPWVNPAIVDNVESLVRDCAHYSGVDRRAISEEIALTAFYHLAEGLAARRERQLLESLAAAVYATGQVSAVRTRARELVAAGL